MPISPGVLIAGTPTCLASMLTYLARLSGRRRRHVRRSSGPGGHAGGAAAAGRAVMEPLDCCRCRGRSCCSCALLGLDQVTDHRPQQQQQQQQQHQHQHHHHQHQHHHRQQLHTSDSVEEDEGTRSSRTRTRSFVVDGTSEPEPAPALERRGTRACGCGDRDVLRRRPPEESTTRPSRLGSCIPPYLATLLILSYSLIGVADACSSRSTPKPRPPTPTPRPNITFHMYTCPPDYAEWYCLNGATCFTVKIVDSLLYNCLCANGYIGQRCEFKDLDGSYLPSRQRVMLETASIAGAVTIAVFLAVITFISVYIHCKRKQKELRTSTGVDAVDGPGRDPELRPFCSRSRSLMIFMAKNPNSSMTAPSIEQTRMPNWNYPADTSTRMASVNENKRPYQ